MNKKLLKRLSNKKNQHAFLFFNNYDRIGQFEYKDGTIVYVGLCNLKLRFCDNYDVWMRMLDYGRTSLNLEDGNGCNHIPHFVKYVGVSDIDFNKKFFNLCEPGYNLEALELPF